MPTMTQAEKISYDLIVTQGLRKGNERSVSITVGDLIPSLGNEPDKIFISPAQIAFKYPIFSTVSCSYTLPIPPDADLNTLKMNILFSYDSATAGETYKIGVDIQQVTDGSIANPVLTTNEISEVTIDTGGQLIFFEKVLPFGGINPNSTVTFIIKRPTSSPARFAGDINIVGINFLYDIAQ
jgi:hypothetical protein